MMKRRIVWIGLIACICLLAGQLTLNATGITADVQPVSDQSEKVLPTPTGATSVSSKAAVGTLKDSGDRPLRTSTVETGKLSSKSDFSKGSRQTATKSIAVSEGNTKASVKFMDSAFDGSSPRRMTINLDDACALALGGSPAGGFLSWEVGDEFKVWIDPADCPTNPGYPFLVETVTFTGADASVFGYPGEGVGTLTYRINIECTADGGTDPCAGPGQIICETSDLTMVCNNEGLQTFTGTLNCCVEGPFFVGLQYIGWTGSAGRVTTPLWDAGDEAACLQYLGFAGTYYDGHDLFTSGPIGTALLDVTGNTNDACTPIPCAPTTGACCDVSTGTCVDGVLESECDGLNQYFYPEETCAELDPPCAACDPAPANDFCGNAYGLTLGTQYCGTADCFLLECEGDIPGVWTSFTTTECLDVTIDFCGSGGEPSAYANIFDGCPCAAGNAIGFTSADDCGDGNYAVTWIDLPAGTYYVPINPGLFPNYCINVTGVPCTPCEPEAVLNLDCTAPQQVTGTTVGEDDDCNDGIPTFVYELNVTEAGMYNFDLCNTDPSWDSYIWVSDECCGDELCVSDDGCGVEFGLSSIACCDLAVGTYYLHISGWGTTDEGAYTLDISCCFCEVICTNNEGETTCHDEYVDNYNGGCNSDPNVWYEYTCGTEICGESGNFLIATENYRDTDWYRLVLTEEQYLTWKVVTEFTASIYLLVPGAPGYECHPDSIGALAGGTTVPCDTATISGCLPAGEYWLFVAPAASDQGTPCGTPYYFYTTCDVCPDCFPDYSISVDCEGYTGTGSTDLAGDDCEFTGTTQDGDTHNDEIWEIEILETGDYRFSLCSTDPSWDTYMFLTSECCGGTFLNDYETTDDGCGATGGPSMTACIPLEPGIVYLMVEGWSTADSGAYTLEIECCDPCIVECTDTELEGDCFDGYDDDFNAGCNMLPATPSFSQNFNNAGPWPQTVCGTSGTHTDGLGDPVRDTDWYEFNLTDTALVNYSGVGEFPLTILIVQDTSAVQACSSYVITSDVADPCSLASIEVCLRPGRYFAWVSVSSGLDADCGSSYEITLDIEYDACVLLPPAPEVCPEEYTMFAQLFNGSSAGTSEIDVGGGTEYKRFENFSGVLDPICDVHWWGIEQILESDWEPCHEIFMDFVITFHTDSSGYPTGVPVCSYTRTVAGAPTTRLFNGDPVYYYETILNIDPDLCCELTDGWISIQGAGATDCWFLWHTSIDGDARSTLARSGIWQEDYASDLSFCLTQAPPPCDPAENLTVYLTSGLGNPHLRWYAPIAEDWNIYRSTDPNNSGDIDDPSYVYQTSVTGSGDLEWIDPAAFVGGDSYVNYIVVPSCYQPE